MELTKAQARTVLDAHLAYEEAGGCREAEWYAGIHSSDIGQAFIDKEGYTDDWIP